MAAKFSVPNWSQNILIEQAGLQLITPVVKLENDAWMWIKDLKTQKEYTIDKKTGRVTVS